jgi:hypothetical protein
MPDSDIAVTPDSKLGELLERWPELQEVLVQMSPHFRALQNPVLRRTVAKIATLRQVSQVSGVALGLLVERIRGAVGLAGGPSCGAVAATPEAAPRPSWAVAAAVSRTFDARAAIESGDHPLPAVMRSLAGLGVGQVYELVTPFVPAPLVDLARGKGFLAYSVEEAEGLVRTYFKAEGTGAPPP